MTRSCLNLRISNLLLLAFTLLVCNRVIAAETGVDSAFRKRCQNSDAYLLYSYSDVTFSKSFSRYKKYTSYQNKLVVNTKAGVEKFALLELSKSVADHLQTIHVSTLKCDGSVVEMDSSLVFSHRDKFEQDGILTYPIPGVEPGDTIQISYEYSEFKGENETGEFVNLYHEVPSLNTEFSIRTAPGQTIRYKVYNGLGDPRIVANDTMIYCLFKKEAVEGLEENQYACLPCELPYFYYSVVKKDSEYRAWKDVYNQEFNYLTQPILLDRENSTYYKRWKKDVLGVAADSSKYYQLNLLLDNVRKNFDILPVQEGELFKSSGYFLKEKHFDLISIRRFYRQVLEDLGIDYWAVFARSKRAGPIDPYYIRIGEYDHIFFAFENEKGDLTLLYPSDMTYKYQIDEIPTALYHTDAVAAKPFLTEEKKRKDKFIDYDLQLAEADSVTISLFTLPGMNANVNFAKQILICQVDSASKEVSFKSSYQLSGGLSTDVRNFFSTLSQNEAMSNFYGAVAEYEDGESAIKVDTITDVKLDSIKPFSFHLKAEGRIENALTFVNDSLVSLSLDQLIEHTEIETPNDSTELDYYLDYSYSDSFVIILTFPYEVELLGANDPKSELKNETGEYSFNMNLVGNKQLVINSSYKIFADLIPKTDYDQLVLLNDQVKEVKNIRLLLKRRKS